MLENYGYEVIDLGKDVPIEEVVKRAKEENIQLIGLSALMTTTVENMKKTIKALKENNINARVFVGGAVVTEEYAQKIKEMLTENNIRVELDDRNEKLSYKMRESQTKKIPYTLILGDKEKESKSIS